MSIADPYVSARRAPVFHLRVMGSHRAELRNPYQIPARGLAYAGQIPDRTVVQRAAPNPASLYLEQRKSRTQTYTTTPILRTYPVYLNFACSIVLIGTIISGLIGYFIPGPITGAALPIFITLWWLLYRIIQRRDERQPV